MQILEDSLRSLDKTPFSLRKHEKVNLLLHVIFSELLPSRHLRIRICPEEQGSCQAKLYLRKVQPYTVC